MNRDVGRSRLAAQEVSSFQFPGRSQQTAAAEPEPDDSSGKPGIMRRRKVSD